MATRNYVQLTLLAPGSVNPNPGTLKDSGSLTAFGGRPYVNGNREQANNFLLDGVDNNQVSDNLVGYSPSPDAIQEFNMITQNASAEFGISREASSAYRSNPEPMNFMAVFSSSSATMS